MPVPVSGSLPSQRTVDSGDVSLLEYFYALVRNKYLIGVATLAGVAIGYIAAISKGPTWVATAVIAPLSSEAGNAPGLAGFALAGGIAEGRFGLGGNTGLEGLDITLDSRDFGASMVREKGLLELIHKHLFPAMYRRSWDESSGTWRSDAIPMSSEQAAGHLRTRVLQKEISRNNTMKISVPNRDSAFADTVLSSYLSFLDIYIMKTAVQKAEDNRTYLEKKAETTTDPLLRQKILQLVAAETEKSIIAGGETFETVDAVFVEEKHMERTIWPIVGGSGALLIVSFLTLLYRVFCFGPLADEDRTVLADIARQLKRLPFAG